MSATTERPTPRIPVSFAATPAMGRHTARPDASSALADLNGAVARHEEVDVAFVYGDFGPGGMTPDEAIRLALALGSTADLA
jgi:hypothetical protein